MYADDMCITAATKETLQLKIKVAARFLAERGLQVNLSKTKVVVFKRSGRISKHDVFKWGDRFIETVVIFLNSFLDYGHWFQFSFF